MNPSAQVDAQGKLRHLLTLDGLSARQITTLLDRAESLRERRTTARRPLDLLHGRTVINLFFEPSTRTRTSFDLAAKRLGANVINFDIASSSTSKGEIAARHRPYHRSDALRCVRRAP